MYNIIIKFIPLTAYTLTIKNLKLSHQRSMEEKEACISQLQRQVETLQVYIIVIVDP